MRRIALLVLFLPACSRATDKDCRAIINPIQHVPVRAGKGPMAEYMETPGTRPEADQMTQDLGVWRDRLHAGRAAVTTKELGEPAEALERAITERIELLKKTATPPRAAEGEAFRKNEETIKDRYVDLTQRCAKVISDVGDRQ